MNEEKVVKSEEVITPEVVLPVEVKNEEAQNEGAILTAESIVYYDEATRNEIMRMSNEIDVRQFEKVMNYGSIPLMRTFEMAGRVLENAQGTSADQEVVKMVAELAKEAKDKYNLVIEEPNFLQKFVTKIMAGFKSDSNEVKVRAISCFKVLQQYVKSCDMWLENLKKTEASIMLSGESKVQACYEIEQYIVAGRIAEDRLLGEVESAKNEWETTGMVEAKQNYDTLDEGLKMFQSVLVNLEKSRAARGLAVGELKLELHSNRRIQLAVDSQKKHSSTVMAEQLEIAYYNAVNTEALDGQKAITELNNKLLEEVAQRVRDTGEEAERILINGVYTPEAAQRAAQTVIDGYNTIKKISDESTQQMAQQMDKLKGVIDELAPYVENLQKKDAGKTSQIGMNNNSSSKGGLVF